MGTFNTKVEVLKLEMVDAIAVYIKHNGPIEICDSEQRFCSSCTQPMDEGFCINGGNSYYCSKRCMRKQLSTLEIEELEIGSDDSESYWTQWEEKAEFENVDNKLTAIIEENYIDIKYHIVYILLDKKSVVFKCIDVDSDTLIEVNYTSIGTDVLAHICDSFIK